MNMDWEEDAEEKFQRLIAKVPVFLRGMAEEKVCRKAESLAGKEGRPQVTEKDMPAGRQGGCLLCGNALRFSWPDENRHEGARR